MITRITHPSEEPLRLTALAAVLHSASTTALRVWHPERADIYHCATRAWRSHNIPVPMAAVTRALRRVAPEGMTLLDYNDGEGRTRAQIAAVFTAARDDVNRQLDNLRAGAPAAERLDWPTAANLLTATTVERDRTRRDDLQPLVLDFELPVGA